ncbi:hypothetical protein ACEQ8H_000800 [Pleosporales sp. CAS-2024a]
MAEDISTPSVLGIAALPTDTARKIGSGQVLVDASSLVKELIENALDARAKSIFVDITANTIDSIQIKDDGHGIPAEDRALVCRRYCTSKIRDFHDLKEVGGRWLGFRGEALSSMVEMSNTLSIVTRVEGEPVAVRLRYSRDGELATTERDSHPVGTTVKVTQIFEHLPVRKQTAIKNATKCLAKIRRLIQAYALARPAVRFRLHVLKAKNNKGDFMYAPKTRFSVEDAVFKVIGKDCALQCDWTAVESDGFEIHAFLPKPAADGPKIANYGAFISIDARPVSNSRGTVKQIVTAYKEYLRKSSPSLAIVKDPFLYMNIICLPGSYDPNIEPAKDDVMFDDASTVLNVVEMLLKSYYPVGLQNSPTSAQQYAESDIDDSRSNPPVPDSEHVEPSVGINEELVPHHTSEPRWRFNMYGIDEDDLEHLQDQPPIVIEEENCRAADVSNPWTIARMNSTIKPVLAPTIGHLPSPAKNRVEIAMHPSSPAVAMTPRLQAQAEPLTPQTSPILRQASQRDIQQASSEDHEERSSNAVRHTLRDAQKQAIEVEPLGSQRMKKNESLSLRTSHDARSLVQTASAQQHTKQRKRRAIEVDVAATLRDSSDDTWFGQPMRGSQPSQKVRQQKRPRRHDAQLFSNDIISNPQPSSAGAHSTSEARVHSEGNADIRTFFGHREHNSIDRTADIAQSSSHIANDASRSLTGRQSRKARSPFKPPTIQTHSSPRHTLSMLDSSNLDRSVTGAGDDQSIPSQNGAQAMEVYEDLPTQSPIRRSSFNLMRQPTTPGRSKEARIAFDLNENVKHGRKSHDMVAYFKDYQDGENIAPPPVLVSSTPRQGPRIIPVHERTTKTRPRRHGTTDGAPRTKSLKLPLEQVPQGYHIQDITCHVHHVSVASMMQSSCKLDMGRNSVAYKSLPDDDDAYDAFAEPITTRMLMSWAAKLDAMLHQQYDRQLPGPDVRSLLHKAIHRELDASKQRRRTRIPSRTADNVVVVVPQTMPIIIKHRQHPPPEHANHPPVIAPADLLLEDSSSADHDASARREDALSEFDMSPFVDFDRDEEEQSVVEVSSCQSVTNKVDEEDFGQQDIDDDDDDDDDMLLDM